MWHYSKQIRVIATNKFDFPLIYWSLFFYLGRKKLLWDAKNMKITNFDEANQFVKREYRDGWKLV